MPFCCMVLCLLAMKHVHGSPPVPTVGSAGIDVSHSLSTGIHDQPLWFSTNGVESDFLSTTRTHPLPDVCTGFPHNEGEKKQ